MANNKRVFERFYRQCCGAGPAKEDPRTADFCFHMTDWAKDLDAFHELLNAPDDFSDDEAFEVIYGFLVHASGHIAAAAKLADIKPVKFETPAAMKAAASKQQS